MPRLPPALEPAFPLVKRTHRFATRRVGALTRARAALAPTPRSLPQTAYRTARETAAAEPGTTTYHPGGPGESLHRDPPAGTPAGHPWWETVRSVEIPPRFVLELAGGTVVGSFGAHLTAGGALDHETSHYYDVLGWHEHPIFLMPRLPRARRVEGSLLALATRGTGVNYYHFLMDLLPRWGAFAEAMPGRRPDVLFANRNTRFARELLALAGLDGIPTIEPTKRIAVRPDRLWVPGLTNTEYLAPRWTTRWLRENLPARRTTDRPRRIYVTRGSARNSRRVNNEAEVLSLLRRHGFTVFDPGRHPVQDQIDTFAAAEVVVGPHGAALTNLNFSPPGVRVLELFAPRYLNPGYWAITDNLPEATYRYLVGVPSPPGRKAPYPGPMNRVYEDITVDLRQLEDSLEELLVRR